MQVEKPQEGMVTIRESRAVALISVLLGSLVIAIWEWYILGRSNTLEGLYERMGPALYVSIALPIFLVPSILKRLVIAIKGRAFIFDQTTGRIRKNKKIIAYFNDVEKVKVINKEIGRDLYLHLRSGRKIRVGKFNRALPLHFLLNELREMIGVPVEDPVENPS